MAKVNIVLSALSIKYGTERTFLASWKATGSESGHVDKFEYIWLYKRSGSGWIEADSGSVDGGVKGTAKEVSWEPPLDAVTVCFKVRATSKTYKDNKKKEHLYFKTTSYAISKKATVSKVIKKGYYAIGSSYTLNPSRPHPLSITVTAKLEENKKANNNSSWATNFEVTWEFFVNEGGQKFWRTGDASSSLPRDTIEVVYMGVIPDYFEQIRVVTKPTSADPSVIVQNEEMIFKSGTKKTVREINRISIFKYPHGDNTVMAQWVVPNDYGIEGFTCRFEALTEGSNRWGNASEMEINPYQWVYDNMKEMVDIYNTNAINKTRTVATHGSYVPTKQELKADMILKMAGKDPVSYLVKMGLAKNAKAATDLVQQYSQIVKVMHDKEAEAYSTITQTEEEYPESVKVKVGTKQVTNKYKFYYSDEYTIPDGAVSVRVTITSKSAETSGFIEKTTEPVKYDIIPDLRTINQSDITIMVLPNTRRSFVATWKKMNSTDVASYEYEWGYKLYGSNFEFWGADSGSVAHDNEKPSYNTNPYDAAENVETVLFRVRPVAKHANDFLGTYSSPVSKSIEPLPEVKINDNTIRIVWPEEGRTDKTLTAIWSINDISSGLKSKIVGYDVVWRYIVKTNELGELKQEGESSTINDPDVTSKAYTAPAKASIAQFRIKPVPSNSDLDFTGLWSEWHDYPFDLKPRSINPGSLTVSYSGGTDRKLRVDFSIADDSHVADYTYSYQTYVRNVLNAPVEEIAYQSPFEFDAPSDAEEIRIKVKPNDDGGSDVHFISEYSQEVKYSLVPDTKSVSNISTYLQRGSKTTVVAVWEIDDITDVDSYSYKWRYRVDEVWFDASTGSTSAETLACTYDAPAQADAVAIKVAPVPKYSLAFKGEDSQYNVFVMPSSTIPDTPAVPTLSINKFRLTAMVDSYDEKASTIEFQFINDVSIEDTFTGQAEILFNRAAYVEDIEPGFGIRARARAVNDEGEVSDWSEYTSDPIYTTPKAPEGVPEVNALSATSVEIYWNAVDGATSYVIQRTTKSRYFDAAPDLVEETTITYGTRAEIQGLEPKSETDAFDGQWFFRIKAVNDNTGESEWSEIASIVLGTVPDAPTTWSSSKTPVTHDDVYLNWIHNSEDGSAQSAAVLEMTVNGVKETHEFASEYELHEPYIYETNAALDQAEEHYFFNIGAYEDYSIQTTAIPSSLLSQGLDPDKIVRVEFSPSLRDADDGYDADLNYILGECSYSVTSSDDLKYLSYQYPEGTNPSEGTPTTTYNNAHLWITTSNQEENVIDISSIPTVIRSTEYGGISKIGSNSEYTDRLASSRIDGDKLYFTLTNTTGMTGIYMPITLSFFREGALINQPTEFTYESFDKVSYERIDLTLGTQTITVDISDIPTDQRDGLTVKTYTAQDPSNVTLLKNEVVDTSRAAADISGVIPKGGVFQIELSADIPEGLRDMEHLSAHLVRTDSDANEYLDDLIESFTLSGTTATVTLSDYSGDDISGPAKILVEATYYSDNYSISSDGTLTHYVYKVANSEFPAQIMVAVEVSKDDVRHRSLSNNFNFSTSGVSHYLIPANTHDAGAVITWKVKTKGVVDEFGPWSVERQINIYTPATIRVTIGSGYQWLTDGFEFNDENVYTTSSIIATSIEGYLETFPMILDIHSGPTTQKPIVYVLSIISNDTYEDYDDTGNTIHIRSGQELYKRYIYTNERDFITLIGASEVNLDNTRSYTLIVTVNTDVGLTAETSNDFVVDWDDLADLELDAIITLDIETATAYLSPSCTNENGFYLNNINLSVYRRGFDGTLTEVASNIPNGRGITITDPHPSLDYGRYRIVATNLETGQMFYEDLAPEPIGITDIIIQWDESWSGYEGDDFPEDLEEKPYKGSILRLPYNIDESESNNLDVELVNYIGRKHPVSYFGTHVGQTASWKTEIPKYDKETIYALRRLAVWPGDCYVRSPSGVGYWAHVKVNFDISHLEPIVPVSLDITRVEGGT